MRDLVSFQKVLASIEVDLRFPMFDCREVDGIKVVWDIIYS